MNRSDDNMQSQRSHQRAQHLREYRSVFVACVSTIVVVVVSINVSAQQGLNRTTVAKIESPAPKEAQSISVKEQVARGLDALRAASSQPDVNAQPTRPKKLFLDLTTESSTVTNDSESSQAMAATLNVSMTSSPTQVVMRAVAWISIVLCVCCLAILAARRWQRERGLLPTTTSRSKVLETLSLGPSRTVSLIEMHGYRALVATDAGGIRSLVLAPSTFEESLTEEEGIANDQ